MKDALFEPKQVRPHQLGWLRRPEMDQYANGHQVWELPDGTLNVYPKGSEPQLVVMPKNFRIPRDEEEPHA